MITRSERFTFVCTNEEKRLIAALAESLNRSQGDAIRFILRAAAQELQINLGPQLARPSQKVPHE